MKRIGIIGASGFTGAELLRICASHPEFKVQIAAADSMSGTKVSDLYPGLAAEYKELVFSPTEPTLFSDCDLVFLCLHMEHLRNWFQNLSAKLNAWLTWVQITV